MKQFEPGELVRLTDSHGTELRKDKPYVIDTTDGEFVKLVGHHKHYKCQRFSRVGSPFSIDPVWLFIWFAVALAVYSVLTTLN